MPAHCRGRLEECSPIEGLPRGGTSRGRGCRGRGFHGSMLSCRRAPGRVWRAELLQEPCYQETGVVRGGAVHWGGLVGNWAG